MHLRSCFLCLEFRRCIFKILQQKKNKLKSLMGPLLRLSLQQSQCLQACSDYLNLCQTLSILLNIYFLPSSAQLILTWWKAACQGCKVEHCLISPPVQLQLHSPAVFTHLWQEYVYYQNIKDILNLQAIASLAEVKSTTSHCPESSLCCQINL